MSEGYVKKLLNPSDTLNVLRELPISSGDFFKERLVAKSRTVGLVTQPYEHVTGDDRVSYFDLRVDSIPSKNLKLHVETQQVSTVHKTGLIKKDWKTLRPCYYLPYRKNGTTRIKLSPPRATTATTSCSSQPRQSTAVRSMSKARQHRQRFLT